MSNGAGRGRWSAVRGCPLGTGQVRCEWHASGTASEGDQERGGAVVPKLDRWLRSSFVTIASRPSRKAARQRLLRLDATPLVLTIKPVAADQA